MILAVNVYSAGDTVRLKIRRGDETIDRTIVLAKYPVEGEVIATNRPKPWRGLRVDYTSALDLGAAFGPTWTDGRRSRRRRGRGRISGRRRGVKKGQCDARRRTARPRPRDFAEAVAALEGPVTLETDLGPVTVSNGGISRSAGVSADAVADDCDGVPVATRMAVICDRIEPRPDRDRRQ